MLARDEGGRKLGDKVKEGHRFGGANRLGENKKGGNDVREGSSGGILGSG